MSYILKALKQAQESRSIDGTPVTAATQRLRSAERSRQIPWRWIAAAALVLNGLVLLLLVVWPHLGSQPSVSVTPPANTATSVPPAASEAPGMAALPPRPVTPPAPAPRPVMSPPPPVQTPAAAIQPPAPIQTPAVVVQPPMAPASPPARPNVASVPQPRPVEPKAVESRPVGPNRPPAVAARPAERTVSAPTERPGGDGTAVAAPPSPPAPVAAAVPPPPQPASEAGPELRDALEKFKLEVLVWAADPRDRMVFLSGRKFVEGQSLDGKVAVERIDEDSIVLAYQGQRVRVKRP